MKPILLLKAALTWLLGPRDPELGYRARKLRQKQAREAMSRELRWLGRR